MRALLLVAVLLSVAHIPTPSQSYTLPYQCTVCRRTMTRFWQQGGDVAALDEAKLCPDIDPDVTHKYCILFENGRCQAWEKSPFYDDNHKVGGNITNPFHPAFSLLSVHERIRIIHHATRLRRYRAFRALLQARKEELEEKEAAAESAEEDSSVSFDAAEAPRLAAERGDGSYKQSEDKRIDPITQLPCSIIGCAHLDGSKPKEPPKPYPDEWCKEIVRFIKNDPLTMQIKAKGCTVKSAGGGYSTHGNFEYRHECPEFAYCTCLRNEKGAAWCAPQAPAPICTPGEPPENLGKEAQLMEEKKLEKSLKNMDALSKKAGDEWFFQTQGPDAYPN